MCSTSANYKRRAETNGKKDKEKMKTRDESMYEVRTKQAGPMMVADAWVGDWVMETGRRCRGKMNGYAMRNR